MELIAMWIGYSFMVLVALGLVSVLWQYIAYGSIGNSQSIIDGKVYQNGKLVYEADGFRSSISQVNRKVYVDGKLVYKQKKRWEKA